MVKQFEEQFGKEWRCQCKADFRPGNLEILSESVNSLLAHYRCPECGREQMLAAAISESEEPIEEPITKQGPMIKLPKTTITADDILDIKQAVSKMKFSSIRSISHQKSKRKSTVTVSRVTSPKH